MNDPGRSLTAAEFAGRVEREHERVDLKTGAGRKPLQETMVAFTNTDGGRIYIGVTDARTVVGRRRDQGLDDDIHGAAADAHSVGRLHISELLVNGKSVVEILVDARRDEVAATSDGRVLIRRGGHNRAAIGRELRDLVLTRSLVRYEATDTGLPLAAIDRVLGDEVASTFGWSDLDPDRLRERGLLTADSTLTIAGALCLTDPSRSLGAAKFQIDIRAYETDEGTSYVRRDQVIGPVQQQVQGATDLVMRDLGTDMVVTNSRRHDVPRLPRRVVREVIANAVAHRTYDTDSSPVVVALRPSSLTVTSPGGLPDPVTVETLRVANAPRNHTVIAVLRRFGLAAEDSGQGIDVIQDDMKLELLADPIFVDTGSSFEVRLPLRGLVSAQERGWLTEFTRTGLVGPPERLLLLALLRQDTLTNGRARELLGEDSTGTRVRLRKLRDAGLIVQHGTRGRAYYTLGRIGPERSNEAVVVEAAAESPLTNERVRSLTGLDRLEALSLLRRLVAEGHLVQEGARRGTRYVLKNGQA